MVDKTNFVGTETDIVYPENGNKMSENSRTYFDNESGLVIWKTVAGHELTDGEVQSILNGETVGPFELNKKDGGTFKASLKLENEKVSFVFENTGFKDSESDFNCPISGEPLRETDKTLFNKESGFTLWKTMAGHKFTNEEIAKLLEGETVGPFNDFVSTKTGKGFEASVVLDENKKTTFVFAAR